MRLTYWLYHYIDRYAGITLCVFLKIIDGIIRSVFPRRGTAGAARNILVIKLAMLGDTILLVPALRALRNKYPGSRITMMCSHVNETIVSDWDFVDDRVVFNFGEILVKPWKFISTVIKLRRRCYDATIDFETWPRIIPVIAFLTGARIRAGFRVPGQMRHYLFTHPVTHVKGRHELLCFSDLVGALGAEVRDTSLELRIENGDREKVGRMLNLEGIGEEEDYVIVHPGAGVHGYYRQWFEDRYAEVADHIIGKHGKKVVLTGTRADGRIVAKVAGCMKNSPVNMAMRTSLKELFALVERAKFVVCANTGILHIATAAGTPVIAIHGPTDPGKWGPWGEGNVVVREDMDCSPCSYLGFEYGCSRRTCLERVTVKEVIKHVDAKLAV